MPTAELLHETISPPDAVIHPLHRDVPEPTTPLADAPAQASDAPLEAADEPEQEAVDDAVPPMVAAEQLAPGPTVGIDDFNDIFERYQTPITNFIFRMVGNREQALDLSQDVFVKVYRSLAAGSTIQTAALSAWVYRIASNTATDALRRRNIIKWVPLSLFNEDRGMGAPGGRMGENTEADAPAATDMSAFASGNGGGMFEDQLADNEVVEAALNRLPEKYRVALLLFEREGFSCLQIAEILSMSPSAVKMRLMRAREKFIRYYRALESGELRLATTSTVTAAPAPKQPPKQKPAIAAVPAQQVPAAETAQVTEPERELTLWDEDDSIPAELRFIVHGARKWLARMQQAQRKLAS